MFINVSISFLPYVVQASLNFPKDLFLISDLKSGEGSSQALECFHWVCPLYFLCLSITGIC